MLQGVLALTLDAKGRMSIPSRHREALQLQAEGRMTVTKHSDGCPMLLPRSEQECFYERIAVLSMEAHWWKRILPGSAADVELDTAGRVPTIPELRVAVSLERDMMLLGTGSHFEVWDAATYTAKKQVAMAQGMPDALKNSSF